MVRVDGGNFNSYDRTDALTVSDPMSRLSFMLGGIAGASEERRPDIGMVEFDASNLNQKWTNHTESDPAGSITPPSVVGGAMVHLPVGEAGALLAFLWEVLMLCALLALAGKHLASTSLLGE